MVFQAVLSADTILLVGKSVNGSPPEITITLSNIQTPKIARGPQQTDEPFAWEAKEFLRRLCIGKQVTFQVVSTVPAINRSFGDVFLNGENLNKVRTAPWICVRVVMGLRQSSLPVGELSKTNEIARMAMTTRSLLGYTTLRRPPNLASTLMTRPRRKMQSAKSIGHSMPLPTPRTSWGTPRAPSLPATPLFVSLWSMSEMAHRFDAISLLLQHSSLSLSLELFAHESTPEVPKMTVRLLLDLRHLRSKPATSLKCVS